MADHDSPQQLGAQFYRAGWIFYLVLAIAGVLWVGFHFGDISLSLFLDRERWWQDLLIGLGAGGGLILLWASLRRWIPAMQEVEVTMRELIGELEEGQVFSLALISGFSEELFFRGAMQSSWGWALAVLIFGLLHTGPGRPFRVWTVFALLAGALFAWLTLLRGNLLPAITAHILVNAINLRRLMDRS